MTNTNVIKGFKVFNPDWTCRDMQYEVGKTFEVNDTPEVCDVGLHFCKKAVDCFNYYAFDPNNKVAEVVALGEVDEGEDKCATNKLQIVREIPWHELLEIVNLGKGNSGHSNTGNRNTGNWNTGNWNTGNRNTGNRNTGNWNTGNRNTGNRNTGNRNTGNWNTGNWNTGNWNTGNWNTGNWNTGNRNTGNWNTGNWNTGNRNTGNENTGNENTGNRNTGNRNTGNWNQGDNCTGDFNISDYNTGCFNTEDHKIRIFDVESDLTFDQWRNSDAYRLLRRIDFEPASWIWSEYMSEEEKAKHPTHKTTGGYLRVNDTSKAFITWWNNLDEYEKDIIKNIPNFNAEKFKLITGIDL